MNRIVNYTIPCQSYKLTDFLRIGAGMERFYFESNQSPVAIAGLGVAAQISDSGPKRFANLSQSVRELFQQIISINETDSTPRPTLLGGGAFFDQMERGAWDSFPSATLVLPRYVLMRTDAGYFFSVNQPAEEDESLELTSHRVHIEAGNFLARMEINNASAVSIPDEIIVAETSRSDWEHSINQVIHLIQQGDLKKVVMARSVLVTGNRSMDVPALLEYLGETCPACFRFLFEFTSGIIFAGVTPERLVSVKDSKFITAAVAGSIRRGDFPGEDETLGQQLLDSAKDQSEHAFVVEQIREKMSPLAKTLHIDSTPQLLRLPNIFHLRTGISGTLYPNQNILNIVGGIHPTPAVGGVPSETALRVIRELEGFERGWYAGPVGWVDANGNGDFVVAIRSGLFRGHTATLFGGAGIVADSDPRKEWDETGLKIRFLLNALQCEMA